MLASEPGAADWSVVNRRRGSMLLAVSTVGWTGRIMIVWRHVVGGHVYCRECKDTEYDEGKGSEEGDMV